MFKQGNINKVHLVNEEVKSADRKLHELIDESESGSGIKSESD